MLPCHSCFIYGTWRSKGRGFKLIIWGEAKGGNPQSQRVGASFMEDLTPHLLYQNYLPISASFDLNRVL